MTKKVRVPIAILTAVLFCGIGLAQRPEVDISPKVHPNLAEAQRLIVQANLYIERAQKANRGDMQDHAEKARQLLAQANHELKAAAAAANAANAKSKR
jgi:signal transduction histidine kinase